MPYSIVRSPRLAWHKPLGLKSFGNIRINWHHSLNRGLKGWWLLNEGCGRLTRNLTVWKQGGRNEQTGSFTGGVAWSGSPWGSAALFNGSSGVIDCMEDAPPDEAFQITGPMTVWGLVMPQAAGDRCIVTHGYYGAGGYGVPYFMRIDGNRQVLWGFFPNGTDYVTSNLALTLGNWYSICGVFDGTSKRIFINGKLDNVYVGSGVQPLYRYKLAIGALDNAGEWAQFWLGYIVSVSIWNRALSDSEACALTTNWLGSAASPRLFSSREPMWYEAGAAAPAGSFWPIIMRMLNQ